SSTLLFARSAHSRWSERLCREVQDVPTVLKATPLGSCPSGSMNLEKPQDEGWVPRPIPESRVCHPMFRGTDCGPFSYRPRKIRLLRLFCNTPNILDRANSLAGRCDNLLSRRSARRRCGEHPRAYSLEISL